MGTLGDIMSAIGDAFDAFTTSDDDDHAWGSAKRRTALQAAVSGSGFQGDTMQKLDLLDRIVAAHETHFAGVAQEAPTDLLRTFMVSRWDPFFRTYSLERGKVSAHMAPEVIAGFIAASAHALSQLRELARANYVPVPDLAQLAAAPASTAVSGPHGGGGGGFHGGGFHGGGWGGGPPRNYWGGGYSWGYGRPWGGGGWGYPAWGYPVIENVYPTEVVYADPAQAQAPQGYDDQGQDPGALAVSGFFDDIGNAVSSAVHGVESAASSGVSGVFGALKKMKGPIEIAAATAAGAAAAGIPGVGPALAPMASGIARSLVDSAAGGGEVKASAKQAVQAVKAQAARDPKVAQALAVAQRAVGKATAGALTVDQVMSAAAGDADAAARVKEILRRAATGDAAALAIVDMVNAASRDLGAPALDLGSAAADGDAAVSGDRVGLMLPPWTVPAALGAAGGYLFGKGHVNVNVSGCHVGAAAADPGALARQAAAQWPGRVVGIVLRSDGSWGLEPFATPDQADDWYGKWLGLPDAYRYVAYFDRSDASFPGPLNEQSSPRLARRHGRSASSSSDTAVSGVLSALLCGIAGFAAGHFGPQGVRWAKAKLAEHKATKAA